ncbi:hypothetical protein CTheo_5520 [Ceratobasidium theobromae]|uniref:Uncharacterized protein n=1 Tax=Ceratobasidium theobromae TaxID=1582974 RepID=A0A5N5QGZ5_9AGAM|nr:hypothetical protein CTheo_5520 [Ceratobasidium theobromae]
MQQSVAHVQYETPTNPRAIACSNSPNGRPILATFNYALVQVRIQLRALERYTDVNLSTWSIANEQLANSRLEALVPSKPAQHDLFLSAGIKHRVRGLLATNTSIAFSPDSTLVVPGSEDSTDTRTRHIDSVMSVAFSPDGFHIASASADRTIRTCDVQNSILLETFTSHIAHIISLAFSSNGLHIASASTDRTIGLWNRMTVR